MLNPYEGIGDPFPFNAPATDAEKAAYQWVTPMAVTAHGRARRRPLYLAVGILAVAALAAARAR